MEQFKSKLENNIRIKTHEGKFENHWKGGKQFLARVTFEHSLIHIVRTYLKINVNKELNAYN